MIALKPAVAARITSAFSRPEERLITKRLGVISTGRCRHAALIDGGPAAVRWKCEHLRSSRRSTLNRRSQTALPRFLAESVGGRRPVYPGGPLVAAGRSPSSIPEPRVFRRDAGIAAPRMPRKEERHVAQHLRCGLEPFRGNAVG